MDAWRTGILAVLAIAACAPPALAYPQADAPALDARVEAAWASEGVQAGGQWQAFLRLRDGSNVTAVGYQACIVPGACIISPRNATRVDERTWSMDTADWVSPLNGKPYPWPAGKVGVKWFLADGALDFTDGQALPRGLAPDDPACMADAAACLETHYLTLDVAAGAKGAPAPGFAVTLLALALTLTLVAGRLRHG